MKTLDVATAADWRAWLAEHHDRENEIWLVYRKKHTGRPTLDYGVSVEEALCWGWVDNLIRRLDDDRFARKFTPRKPGSKWSPSNKTRITKLEREGRMAPPGQALVDQARADGSWDAPDRPVIPTEPTPDFATALAEHPTARAFFDGLTPAQRKQYIGWIAVAKRPATRERRITESIAKLERREKLGMV